MPTTSYSEAEMKEGKDLISLLVDTKIAKNRSEGRRLIEQNGISVNGVKVTDVKAAFSSNDFDSDGELIIQKGKYDERIAERFFSKEEQEYLKHTDETLYP
ncbi:MAG: hypothetical protein IJP84_05240 [Lachnospiraceae bacterium]|nr:hypothetical protein [Lachnospiraceae bacterium]